jgi:triacylglycerol esterase/lipase EstA (alpha/beta hydrolase family)
MMAAFNTHSKEYLTYLRSFTEAVLKYTGAEKINIVGHSMGVTLGRGVIKGGQINNGADYPFDLGPSLADKVDTFIGIAGANYGLVTCGMTPVLDTCNWENGFYPGTYDDSDLSVYLK